MDRGRVARDGLAVEVSDDNEPSTLVRVWRELPRRRVELVLVIALANVAIVARARARAPLQIGHLVGGSKRHR